MDDNRNSSENNESNVKDKEEFKYTNRLADEASPYLQQHAHNPVDWYPWGEEAIEKARREDKPIFLSIGYSTCHWCHVMERETFEKEEFAPYFNDNFVCIKVDREEMPDLDHIYMNYTQQLTGQGGWPNNVFLTPELKPFYAATYIPPYMKFYSPGIVEVLNGVSDLYHNKKDSVLNITESITERINATEKKMREEKGLLGEENIHELKDNLTERFDKKYGGFGSRPKFPTPQNLIFLLDYHRIFEADGKGIKTGEKSKSDRKNVSALKIVEKTIESIYRGGIYDHVGGGISRYSVDEFWMVPHFEKMLYDNALFLEVLSSLYMEDSKPQYIGMFYKTVSYVKDRLMDPDGLFYSAEDADSEDEEGKFYVFTEEEIDEILKDKSPAFKKAFMVKPSGNFEGKNILNLINSEISVENEEEQKFSEELNALYEERNKRIRPHRDEKILFSWNSMVVRSLALSYNMVKDEELLQMAVNAMDLLMDRMYKDGEITASMKDGKPGKKGTLDDYAYGAYALLTLYEVTTDYTYLLKAMEITQKTINHFWDKEHGGFHIAPKERKDLIMNPVDGYDSAVSSGNGIMGEVLHLLSLYTHDVSYREYFDKLMERFSSPMEKVPEAYPTLMDAFMKYSFENSVAVITGPDFKSMMLKLKEKKHELNLPRHIQFIENGSPLLTTLEFFSESPEDADDGCIVLYQCAGGTCSLPLSLGSLEPEDECTEDI